ncbi:hypothetical protein, partial [Granulicella sp. S190]|uniref:hypothetical protein n=1 Tax=Granulicella sp. S190 TaxID=1747226 RepID=UPI001C203F15
CGGGGPSGGGNPPFRSGPPPEGANPQQPINTAQDVKMMGQLPTIFTGDRSKAEYFIEAVKMYFCLNEDVAGMNLPKK